MAGMTIEACYSLQAGWVKHDYDLEQAFPLQSWQGIPETLEEWLEDYRKGKVHPGANEIFRILNLVDLRQIPLRGRYNRRVRLLYPTTGHLAVLVAERIGAWGFSPLWQGVFSASGQLVPRHRFWEEYELRAILPHLPERAEAVLYLPGLYAAIRWLDGEPTGLEEWVQPTPGPEHRALLEPAVRRATDCWEGAQLLWVEGQQVHSKTIGVSDARTYPRHLA